MLFPARDVRMLLVKWIVALLVPIVVFTFIWSGEAIVNNVLLGFMLSTGSTYDTPTLVQAAIFIVIFYATVIALAGYLVAADSGRLPTLQVWIDILIFTLVPLFLVINTGLIIGIALCAIIWPVYFYIRGRVRKARNYVPPSPLESLEVLNAEQRVGLMNRAEAGGFWFATAFAVVSLIADLIFFFTGTLPTVLLIWVVIRTLLLPVLGYFLGRLGGIVALRRTIPAESNGTNGSGNGKKKISTDLSERHKLEVLSESRAREEAKDLVPNDLPLRSSGAQRFYLMLLVAFVLFYPVLDPFLDRKSVV